MNEARLCYQCKKVEFTEEDMPFCSKQCHELYKGKMPEPKRHQQKSIDYIQKKLLEFGKNAKDKPVE